MNELSEVTGFRYEDLGHNGVVMRFDLNSNPNLRDKDLIRRCMDDYVLLYPSIAGYAVKFFEDYLTIHVFRR